MTNHSILLLIPIFMTAIQQAPFVESVGVDFEREVRPLLARNCFPCHGNDSGTRKADLRLDDRDSATQIKGWKIPAISPGDAESSLLMHRIEDDSDPMPPEGHPRLKSEERDLLRRWINQGAEYSSHWSWQPLRDEQPLNSENSVWIRDPVDAYVLEGLKSQKISPAPEIDPLFWLRRVTFDLTGLPPSPAVVEEFSLNHGVEARKKYVELLLEDRGYAEHFTRHWLDLVRYAETHGHEFDYAVGPAHEYRDWVIQSIERDDPIDQFVKDQIAGDLVAAGQHSELESESARIRHAAAGTGWWWLSQATHGPVDVLGDTLNRVDNQIDVISRAFLGATVSCARCHDHKFDRISQADWTALSGIVRSTRRVVHPWDRNGEIHQRISELKPLMGTLSAALEQGMTLQETLPLASWMLAAKALRDVMPDQGEKMRSDILLQSFEDGWSDWVVEGDAFGKSPHHRRDLIEQQSDFLQGENLATSHDRRQGNEEGQDGSDLGPSSDLRKGRLISPQFELNRDYLTFFISGGNHGSDTCVRLIVDGQVIKQASGNQQTRMDPVRWDVADKNGKSARIEVIDDHEGGWGHITCDHFVLTDVPPKGMPTRQQLTRRAKAEGIDKEILKEWVRLWPQVIEGHPVGRALSKDDVLISNCESSEGWTLDGPAFDDLEPGDWTLIGMPRFQGGHSLHSAAISRALRGTALSRNFLAERRFLHVGVQGEDCQVRVSIEGYWMNQHNALLFENFIQPVQSLDRWQHMIFDLERYQGRNIHVEIHDPGDGWVSVDRVWLSDDRSAGGLGPDWSVLNNPGLTTSELLSDPSRLERLLTLGLLDPSRWGEAWNAAVYKAVIAYRDVASKIPDPTMVLACSDAPVGFDVPIQIRGESGKVGELVSRGAIKALGQNDRFADELQGSGRWELAQWVTSPENPLFWRVQANRIWKWVMGKGLVSTPDDMGMMGTAPQNQRLLDHLALRLSRNASRKELIRDLVLSSTYAMDSLHPDPDVDTRDSRNDYWHRAEQKRLTAESIRDGILVTSGGWVPSSGGPPVPTHLNDFLTGRGRPGQSGPLDGDGSRSLYLEVRRNFLNPFFTVFDFPIPATTVGKRTESNVPAQALTLMNSPFVHEQAERWGGALKELSETVGIDGAIDHAWKQALGRWPSKPERQFALELIGAGGQEDWADLAHTIYQTKEFRFVR